MTSECVDCRATLAPAGGLCSLITLAPAPDPPALFRHGLGAFAYRPTRQGCLNCSCQVPQHEPGDLFKASAADTLLHYIKPKASPLPRVTLFSKPGWLDKWAVTT